MTGLERLYNLDRIAHEAGLPDYGHPVFGPRLRRALAAALDKVPPDAPDRERLAAMFAACAAAVALLA